MTEAEYQKILHLVSVQIFNRRIQDSISPIPVFILITVLILQENRIFPDVCISIFRKQFLMDKFIVIREIHQRKKRYLRSRQRPLGILVDFVHFHKRRIEQHVIRIIGIAVCHRIGKETVAPGDLVQRFRILRPPKLRQQLCEQSCGLFQLLLRRLISLGVREIGALHGFEPRLLREGTGFQIIGRQITALFQRFIAIQSILKGDSLVAPDQFIPGIALIIHAISSKLHSLRFLHLRQKTLIFLKNAPKHLRHRRYQRVARSQRIQCKIRDQFIVCIGRHL